MGGGLVSSDVKEMNLKTSRFMRCKHLAFYDFSGLKRFQLEVLFSIVGPEHKRVLNDELAEIVRHSS